MKFIWYFFSFKIGQFWGYLNIFLVIKCWYLNKKNDILLVLLLKVSIKLIGFHFAWLRCLPKNPKIWHFYLISIVCNGLFIVVVGLASFRPRFADKCDRQSRDLTESHQSYWSYSIHTWDDVIITPKYSKKLRIFLILRRIELDTF